MNRQLESMTRLQIGGLRARIWRTESDLAHVNNEDLQDLGLELNARWEPPEINDVAERLAALDRVSAVEVLDYYGNGVLIYPDWK